MFPTPDHVRADASLRDFRRLTRREQSVIIERGKKVRHVNSVNSENIDEILEILNETLDSKEYKD